MSVDNSLERIAAALERLASNAGAMPYRSDVTPEAIIALQKDPGTVAAPEAPAKRGRPAKTEAPAALVVTPAQQVDPVVAAVLASPAAKSFLDDEPTAAPTVERPKATRDNVRSALVAVQKSSSPDEAFALLKAASGGAETIGAKTTQTPKGLGEDKFDAVIAAAVAKIGSAEKTVAFVTEMPLRKSLADYLGVSA